MLYRIVIIFPHAIDVLIPELSKELFSSHFSPQHIITQDTYVFKTNTYFADLQSVEYKINLIKKYLTHAYPFVNVIVDYEPI